MQLPLPGGEDTDAPAFGSGDSQQRRRGPKSPFELPSEEDFLKDGEATVQYWKDLAERVRMQGAEVRCSAVTLGSVVDTFPRLRSALEEADLSTERVEGLWVVPPFVLKDLGTHARWHEAKGRLGPFLKNDAWRKIDAEVHLGRAVDWAKMGLLADNLVVVKHRATWRAMVSGMREHVTWDGAKRLALAASSGHLAASPPESAWPRSCQA